VISTSQFKTGKVIKIDRALYYIVHFQHIKPGKGGAFVRTKLRNLKHGAVIDRTFRSGEKFDEAYIDEKKLQYLYHNGTTYHFMDLSHYDQMELGEDILGDCMDYVKENDEVTASLHEGKIIGIRPPLFVELKVMHTEPGIRGDTAKGGSKPATLETGLTLQVPLFINQGDILKVDTRSGGYVGRA
jgi:elongation factor P